MTRRLSPIERLQKSSINVDKLRAEMARPTWEQTLADAKAGDDVALLKIEAATELYNQGVGCWSPTQKKVVYAAGEKERAEKWARRVAIERIRKYAPEIKLRAESAPTNNIEKRADAQEKQIMGSIFRGSAFDIKKSEDVQEFEFTPSGLKKVPATDKLDSPKPEDAKRDPQYPADSFLRGTSGDLVGPPTTPYDVRLLGLPGTVVPDPVLFAEATEGDPLDEPGTFSPSQPGRNPADGPKSVRLGDARVPLFKRKPGLFNDLLLGPEKEVI